MASSSPPKRAAARPGAVSSSPVTARASESSSVVTWSVETSADFGSLPSPTVTCPSTSWTVVVRPIVGASGSADGHTSVELVSVVRVGGCWSSGTSPGFTASSVSAQRTGSTTASTVVRLMRAPLVRLAVRRPWVGGVEWLICSPPPVRRRQAEHDEDHDRDALHDEQHDAKPRDGAVQPGGVQRPVDLPRPGGAVLGARLHEADRRVEHRRHVAVGWRRQHDVLDPALAQAVDDLGRRPRDQGLHLGGEVVVLGGEVDDLVLAERHAVTATDRVGEAVVDAAADDEDAVTGAGLGALHHVDRDVGVDPVGDHGVRGQPPDQARDGYGGRDDWPGPRHRPGARTAGRSPSRPRRWWPRR